MEITQETFVPFGLTRWEHGSKKIFRSDEGIYLLEDSDKPLSFSDPKTLLSHILGGKRSRMSLHRYLHPKPEPSETILDLLGSPRELIYTMDEEIIKVPPSSVIHTDAIVSPILTQKIEESFNFHYTKTIFDRHLYNQLNVPPLGIDLLNRGIEVRKLLFAGFSHLIKAGKHDPEEVLQEVYRGIETRNRGKCPWDPRKSTFGHYVYMVIRGVLRNYHRKEMNRRTRFVPISMEEDWSGPSMEIFDGTDEASRMALERLYTWLQQQEASESIHNTMPQILPMMLQGYTRDEMVERTTISKATIGKTIRWIRDMSAIWGA